MYRVTGGAYWRDEAARVAALLISTQSKDGGFDIGYAFNFGLRKKKGTSSTPELYSVVALVDYKTTFDTTVADQSIKKGIQWIKENSIRMPDDSYTIPYCPKAIRETVVINGVSFALGAIGSYLSCFKDISAEELYIKLGRFINSKIELCEGEETAFWPYFDQKSDIPSKELKDKVDFYHQMQQIEMHTIGPLADKFTNSTALWSLYEHVRLKQDEYGYIPYANHSKYFGENAHLWGLVSFVTASLRLTHIAKDEIMKDRIKSSAVKTMEWVIDKGWNGEYFWGVVNKNGTPVGYKGYLPRSDAWVFNALSLCQVELGEGPWTPLLDVVYKKLASCNYSGRENHSRNLRTTILANSAKIIRQIKS